MRKLLVALTLMASLVGVSTPVADAHTLGQGRAKAAAENAVLRYLKSKESDLGYGTFSPPLSSKRVSRHKWVFKFDFRFDGDATTEGECKVSAWYANARTHTIRSRVYAVHVD
jgi:hypothetical protein